MKKFAGLSYDVTDLLSDGKIEYLIGLTKDDPDELIKNAHIPSKEEVENMSTEDFALVVYHPHVGFLKKFAMTDKYVTKLNLKIFQDTYQQYPDEIAKTAAFHMQKAAKHFHVTFPAELKKLAEGKHVSNIVDLDDINQLSWHKKQASFVKVASPKEFALPERQKYPLDTPRLTQKAVEYFEKNATYFDPQEALIYAANTLQAARKQNISVEGTCLEKYSQLTTSAFNEDYKSHILARRIYVIDEDRDVYVDLARRAEEFGVVKTAELLEEVDRKLGVDRVWGSQVEDPYLSVLGLKKEASCTHKGKKVKQSMLKKAAENIVDAATLQDLEGPDGLDVFTSLPTPIKDKIVSNL
jgi:hypothetical protein